MKTKISIALPQIISVQDYHEFNDIVNNLETLSNSKQKIKYKELTEYFDGYYFGVIYSGQMPKKDEIKKLAKKLKIKPVLIDEEE